MKRHTLLAGLLLTTLAFATEVQTVSIVRPTHFQEDLLVQGYDTTHGPIRGISICYRFKHIRSIRAENSDAGSALVNVSFQPGFLELRSEGDVLVNIPFAPEAQSFMLAPFDGTIDYDGPSGFKFRSVEHGAGILFFDDPVMMDRFFDVPNAAITVQGFDLFTASGAGNLDAISDSKIIFQGEVVYIN